MDSTDTVSTASGAHSRNGISGDVPNALHNPAPDQGNENASRKRNRASLACRECRSRKIKCDTHRPICGTCRARGRNTTCSYESLVDRDKRRETER